MENTVNLFFFKTFVDTNYLTILGPRRETRGSNCGQLFSGWNCQSIWIGSSSRRIGT